MTTQFQKYQKYGAIGAAGFNLTQAPAASGPIVSDDFTGTPDALLTARNPDVQPGADTWALHVITAGTISAVIGTNNATRKVIAGDSSGAAAYTIDHENADVTIDVDFTPVTGDQSGIAYRTTDGSNYWLASATPIDGKKYITEETLGVFTHRASQAAGITAGVTYALKLVLSGDSFTFTVDDDTPLISTSSIRQTNTNHGIGVLTGTAAQTWDNYTASAT